MVPTKMLICVTPDEKILGSNLLKKNFICSSIFILILKIGLKFFLTKKVELLTARNLLVKQHMTILEHQIY